MQFNDLDRKMRLFETAHDQVVLPTIFMVARIDGRSFTKLTKERHQFEAPYDPRFRDMMVNTVAHLMQCGFRVAYGYTQSDEISLLFHREIEVFERKTRKYNSILAGEASAKFALQLGDLAAFDCRISQLPTADLVLDYFRWRHEDAQRNALNAHCYWLLRKRGQAVNEATNALHKLSVSAKNELLFSEGINFNNLPNWQKRGIGLYWEAYEKEGVNPQSGEAVTALRRRIKIDDDLPMKEEYSRFLETVVLAAATTP